ncbi:MAG: GNAT family N-acetyltransferase [Bdellovibrionales bacterium]
MHLHLESNLESFLTKTRAYLERDPHVNSMIRSLAFRTLAAGKSMPLLAVLVDSKGEVHAAGLQADRDRSFLISKISLDLAKNFAQALANRIEALPGVYGPKSTVEAFFAEWAANRGATPGRIKNLRLFALDELLPPKTPSGFARFARPADRDLLFSWLRAFHDEAVPDDPSPTREELYKNVDLGIAKQEFFIWEDEDKPVSLVGSRRETAIERWIAPVYTPHALRGRGYGSALTAVASQRILESGKKALLFTDLANPISNSIYQKIGYRPLEDFRQYSF